MTDDRCLPADFALDDDFPLGALSGRAIAASQAVHRTLGFGFLEAVYRRGLAAELTDQGVSVDQEVPYKVFYRGRQVGLYRADLLIDGQMIIEVKTGMALDPTAVTQTLNYLRATGLRVGLVIHFGRSVTVKRVIAPQGSSRRTGEGGNADQADLAGGAATAEMIALERRA